MRNNLVYLQSKTHIRPAAVVNLEFLTPKPRHQHILVCTKTAYHQCDHGVAAPMLQTTVGHPNSAWTMLPFWHQGLEMILRYPTMLVP